MKKSWIVALLLLAGGTAVAAPSPRVDLRQHAQGHRIAHGIQNGELTRREAHGLIVQQKIVARTERVLEADGRLGPAEARHLNRMQNAASRSIYRQKHDRQRRW